MPLQGTSTSCYSAYILFVKLTSRTDQNKKSTLNFLNLNFSVIYSSLLSNQQVDIAGH